LSSRFGDDLVAVLTICSGKLAHGLRLLVHPEAKRMVDEDSADPAEAVLHWGLARLGNQPPKPVYCHVRQYESGIRNGLDIVGFEPYATRSLMVKHTVAWIKTPIQELVPNLKSSAEPVPPTYRINGEPELKRSEGKVAAGSDA
jgi:hypothetical protein